MQGIHPLLRVFNPPHPPKKTEMNTSCDFRTIFRTQRDMAWTLRSSFRCSVRIESSWNLEFSLLMKGPFFFVVRDLNFPQYFFCLNMMGFDSRCMQFFFPRRHEPHLVKADFRSFRLWGLRMRSKFLVPRWWSTCQQVQRFPWRCPTCRWRKDKSLRRCGRCGLWEIDLGMGCNHVFPPKSGVTNGQKDEQTTDVNNGEPFWKRCIDDDTPLIQLIVCCSNWRSFMSSY